jgi:hypothetical protein
VAARRARTAASDASHRVSQQQIARPAHFVAAFRRGLFEIGYIEGQNVRVEYRWARGQYDQLPVMAVETYETSCGRYSGGRR